MIHCPDLQARRRRLKEGLMEYALHREPDLDREELLSYLSDGVDEAFAPILALEDARGARINAAESRWRDREYRLIRAAQAPFPK